LAAALALTVAPAAFGASGDPPMGAGWHGREIREPLPQRVGDSVPAGYPRGWSAGGVGRGSGYGSGGGSRRVREVQRRLVRRGYRPGPVDGRFGARTRAAVLWFQIKHGLPRTGRVDARSVVTLRRARSTTTTPDALETPAEASALARSAPPAASTSVDGTWLRVLAVLLALGVAGVVWWVRAELRARRSPPTAVGRAQVTAAAPTPVRRAPVVVVGYVALARGSDREREIDRAARAIGSWCDARRWQLARVVHDVEATNARLSERPGLAYVLEQITTGRVAGLVVAQLGDLTRSVSELAQLLRWLHQAGAFVIALDYELDTSTAAGDLAAGALMEIGEWERERIAQRTRPGLRAMAAHAGTRASVRDDPELTSRIRQMRAQGLSLQAISDTLNAEGVPTLRGGAHWRPSSVQAATGYKRPPQRPNTQQRWDEENS
jgi:DNA invertase Pin-like site-specific DNA recombinase/peptidoglycan hydrolase-like protein with peptidoglycan-binding domain